MVHKRMYIIQKGKVLMTNYELHIYFEAELSPTG